jgi:hypothetical protein
MNIRMNGRMAALYHPGDSPALSRELEELLSGGFASQGHCVFLAKLFAAGGNARRDMFPDDVGYECFVNHFHFKGGSERDLVSMAVEFCRRAGSNWRRAGFPGELRFIVSVRDDECTTRFHLVREGPQWLDGDLESYRDEAILTCDTIA